MSKIGLLTGIPRSGTTLCCSLLNQVTGTIALHEPINPSNLNLNKHNALDILSKEIFAKQRAIKEGLPFENGDSKNLKVSNPIDDATDNKHKIRKQVSKRGLITVPSFKGTEFNLFIKQNALFTAYLAELTKRFSVLCIVRNPVQVMLSWWSVDLPINKGYLPAGQKNSVELDQSLQGLNQFQRQCQIYTWFCRQFVNNPVNYLKYEDLVKNQATDLFSLLELRGNLPNVSLSFQKRVFQDDVLSKLSEYADLLLNLDCQNIYSKEEIKHSLDSELT